MNLLLRLLWLKLAGRFRPRAGVLDPIRTPFRVLPTDLDVLRHVNNGVYLSLLDVARMDLLERTGLGDPLKERGWFPVVTGESIGFRRPLTLFQRFEVETRILGWDDRSFYVHQRFLRAEQTVASALVVGRFLSREGGSVATADVTGLVGVRESPPMPTWATRLGSDQEGLRRDALASDLQPE